jgi:hypothetical protein
MRMLPWVAMANRWLLPGDRAARYSSAVAAAAGGTLGNRAQSRIIFRHVTRAQIDRSIDPFTACLVWGLWVCLLDQPMPCAQVQRTAACCSVSACNRPAACDSHSPRDVCSRLLLGYWHMRTESTACYHHLFRERRLNLRECGVPVRLWLMIQCVQNCKSIGLRQCCSNCSSALSSAARLHIRTPTCRRSVLAAAAQLHYCHAIRSIRVWKRKQKKISRQDNLAIIKY